MRVFYNGRMHTDNRIGGTNMRIDAEGLAYIRSHRDILPGMTYVHRLDTRDERWFQVVECRSCGIPLLADGTVARNRDGLPLPIGEPVEYLGRMTPAGPPIAEQDMRSCACRCTDCHELMSDAEESERQGIIDEAA